MSRVERESRSVWWLSLAPSSGTADASVWVALAGGGHGVSVLSQDGVETAFIEIPEPLCTSLCFCVSMWRACCSAMSQYTSVGSRASKALKTPSPPAHVGVWRAVVLRFEFGSVRKGKGADAAKTRRSDGHGLFDGICEK